MKDELQAIDDADETIRAIRKGRFGELRLINGIVLKLKPIPPYLLQAIGKKYKTPDPPVVWMEEKGRNEPNPDDPEYKKQLEALEEEQELAVQNIVYGAGTEVLSVPEGFFRPEDDGWVSSVEFAASLGGTSLELDFSSDIKRYLCWLRFYALDNAADAALAEALPMQLAGIREGELQEALAGFHGVSKRGTDIPSADEPGDQNGNNPNRANRRANSRNRRT